MNDNKERISMIEYPHLPQSKVTVVAVSEEYPQVISALENLGCTVLTVKVSLQLDKPVASHADMQLMPLGGEHFLIAPNQTELISQLSLIGAKIWIGEQLEAQYPKDVVYNAVRLKNNYICNNKTISKTAKAYFDKQGLNPILVAQGYTKCSVCVVDENSIITADVKIAAAAKSAGIDVLQIRPGYIKIPNYDTGFIGGCCGKLNKDQIAFTGKLSTHQDAEMIKQFLQKRKIEIIELTDKPLFDIGSIIPICTV